MKIPTKEEIDAVARKLWPEGERREGRQTVRGVLEAYRALLFKRARRRILAARRAPQATY